MRQLTFLLCFQVRNSRPEVFCNKGVLRNFAEFTGCVRVSFLIKKETLVQVLSCEFCEISKNTFSYRTPPVAASEHGGIKYHLSHIFPMTPLDPHENIRKPKIFDVFKGYRKGAWVKCVTISKLYLKPYLLLIRRTKT